MTQQGLQDVAYQLFASQSRRVGKTSFCFAHTLLCGFTRKTCGNPRKSSAFPSCHPKMQPAKIAAASRSYANLRELKRIQCLLDKHRHGECALVYVGAVIAGFKGFAAGVGGAVGGDCAGFAGHGGAPPAGGVDRLWEV